MPTGTGKTVCLLSLILSYIKAKKPTFKLIYCTRTIVEMEKTLEELKFVLEQREKDFPTTSSQQAAEKMSNLTFEEEKTSSFNEMNVDHQQLNSPVLALCLSSRRNLCIHPKVSKEDDRERVDSQCR
jgi:DNA excision repair protein ERCC-2